MPEPVLTYPLAGDTPLTELKSKLLQRVSLITEEPAAVSYTYYDSFDWRIYNSGAQLVEETTPGTHTLSWSIRQDPQRRISLRVERTPSFAGDLPPGPLHDRLQSTLEMRTLLPRITIETARYPLRLLNKDRKTVLRLVLEENHLPAGNGGKPHDLGKQLHLLPVKGYPKPFNRMSQLLLRELGVAPAEPDNPMLAGLKALGIRPGDYSSKLRLRLDADMAATPATQYILGELLSTLEANEAGTRADLDSEFLHDFRVAVRRTRSALSQIKGVFDPTRIAHFRLEFAWLGQVTGPTRDMDVYLLKFDAYRRSLPAAVGADLEPLHGFLRAHQKTEHRRLIAALDSPRYQALLEQWRAFLQAPPLPRVDEAPHARRPVAELASERIWRMYRRVLREGRAIDSGSPAEALHELRKTCKKLRYLMEFFTSLYPPEAIKRLIKALKGLQENLGDFQDLEVQVQNLKTFGEQMVAEGNAPPQTLIAMGMLVADLSARQQRARDEFENRFAAFTQADNRGLFKALFADRPKGSTPIS